MWIFDLVESSLPAVQEVLWERYGDYLTSMVGTTYREHVFDYIASEDTPRPLLYQLDLLCHNCPEVEVLHLNSCFAAFGGVKH